jgi:cell division transport system ATP-binding protein
MGITILVATHNEAMVKQFGHPRIHLTDGALEKLSGRSKRAVS